MKKFAPFIIPTLLFAGIIAYIIVGGAAVSPV